MWFYKETGKKNPKPTMEFLCFLLKNLPAFKCNRVQCCMQNTRYGTIVVIRDKGRPCPEQLSLLISVGAPISHKELQGLHL